MNRKIWICFAMAAAISTGSFTLVAQQPAAADTSQQQTMQGSQSMKGMDGMMGMGMQGRGGMCSMMCPMMGGGGMGMGMMMGMMVLMGLFWIAGISALFALTVFLIRRSRPPVSPRTV